MTIDIIMQVAEGLTQEVEKQIKIPLLVKYKIPSSPWIIPLAAIFAQFFFYGVNCDLWP